MKKDFESVFDKNISIDEYKLDNLLNKNIEINEKEFPAILIDKNDDINKYININNKNVPNSTGVFHGIFCTPSTIVTKRGTKKGPAPVTERRREQAWVKVTG